MEAMTPMRDHRGGETKGLRNLTRWKGPVDPEPAKVTGNVC